MKTKITKESRNLLIALLIGDGTICKNNVFKIAHCEAQLDYLQWKIKQLNEAGIRNNGIKSYIKIRGFKPGVPVYYTQLNIIPFIKVLRRVFYKSKKVIGNSIKKICWKTNFMGWFSKENECTKYSTN